VPRSQVVSGIRTVASFGAEERLYTDYCARVDEMFLAGKMKACKDGFGKGIAKGAIFYIMASMQLYGSWLAAEGYMEFDAPTDHQCSRMNSFEAQFRSSIGEQLFVPIFTLFMTATALGQIAQAGTDAKAASEATTGLFSLLDRASLLDWSADNLGSTLDSVRGEIEVKDVVFAYPTRADHLICRGYTLKIDAGTVCALCGPSGSGKSTIIALLERFYDPQSGSVSLDGVDIKKLSVKWLRQQLGLVGQEPTLFIGSVAENIGYGKEGATRAEIEEAAQHANAHKFIMNDLAEGYETQVGQGGGKLSGGQKQRVAIARALVRKPSVLLLDEATSALDNESERIVQAALDEIMSKQKRTTVVIAHRLSTIKNSDKIAVVSKGTIVEEGGHDGLVALGGIYANLLSAQADGAASLSA